MIVNKKKTRLPNNPNSDIQNLLNIDAIRKGPISKRQDFKKSKEPYKDVIHTDR